MKHVIKIPLLTAAWMLCCGFADSPSCGRMTPEMNRQLCASLPDNSISTVCESSVAACRHITDTLHESAESGASGQNLTDQDAQGQNAGAQDAPGQNADAQDASGQDTAYISDGRYLIQYSGTHDNHMGIYDLDTLQDGAFGDYVIRYYDGFRFTENMKDVFLKTAMNDASFQGEPYFTYYAESSLSRLELYTDEIGTVCGICYDENVYDDGIAVETSRELNGFVCTLYCEIPWEGSEYYMTFETETYYRNVPSIQNEEGFRNYQESYEYNDAGQVTAFWVEAETNSFSDEWMPITVADYRCVYHENGNKKEEDLFRHSLLFSTFASSVHIDYDEAGRVTYIHSYITHGSLDYYFIYENDGDIPAYGIVVDHYPGPVAEGIFYRYTR